MCNAAVVGDSSTRAAICLCPKVVNHGPAWRGRLEDKEILTTHLLSAGFPRFCASYKYRVRLSRVPLFRQRGQPIGHAYTCADARHFAICRSRDEY